MEEIAVRDLQQMYERSLCKYKDNYIYILSIEDDEQVEYLDLNTQRINLTKFNSEDFDFTPVRIGYVNYRGVANYIIRNPIRQFKAGTAPTNCHIVPINIKLLDHKKIARVSESQMRSLEFNSIELLDALNNNYPSIENIVKDMKENKAIISLAFDKQFAIDYKYNIYYRNKLVGKFIDNNIKLLDQYEYLTRCLYVNIGCSKYKN